MNRMIQKYIRSSLMMFGIFLVHAHLDALPVVTTFLNKSGINVNLLVRLQDKSVVTKGIAIAQLYEVVNFPRSEIVSIAISSFDKDKNGNLYRPLKETKLPRATDNITYEITLKDVPAYQVAAIDGMEAYTMPASQEIVCVPVVVKAQPNRGTKAGTKAQLPGVSLLKNKKDIKK